MLELFHIDAFTSKVFKGNPACVVFLKEQLSDSDLLNIAKENSVPETAFILELEGGLLLRWFTPDLEMDLCGHATLASAFVIFNYFPRFVNGDSVKFSSCEGDIFVQKQLAENGEWVYTLDFPIREAIEAKLPENIYNSLSIKPKEVYLARDYHLVYERADDILNIKIDRKEFDKINLGQGGVVISSPAPKFGDNSFGAYNECDFISRFFTPQATILEDPVTGSAHCTLAPYWRKRLNKQILKCLQVSERGGELICNVKSNRVFISGNAVCYLKGHISI